MAPPIRHYPIARERIPNMAPLLDRVHDELAEESGTIVDPFLSPTFRALVRLSQDPSPSDDPGFIDLAMYGPPDEELNDLRTLPAGNLHVAHLNWRIAGRKVYDVDERLGRALLNTEVNCSLTDIALPVPETGPEAIFLTLPRELFRDSGIKVDGVYVQRRRTPVEIEGTRYPAGSYVLVTVKFFDTSDRVNVRAETGQLVLPICEELAEDWLQRSMSNAGFTGRHAMYGHELMRVVLNTLLYIQSADANLMDVNEVPEWVRRARRKGSKLERTRAREYAKTNDVRYVAVGRTLAYNENEQESETSASSGSERKISQKFIVRGHWREQPCGKERKDRKRLWIKPFWKGPDWGTVSQRAMVQKIA
jgi:hypothetical protein